MLRYATLATILVVTGCAGGDDDGGSGGDGDGTGVASCRGEVTGEVAGSFSDCVATINHYPDGGFDDDQPSWIFTLLVAPEGGAELDPPLESIGINFVIAGAPAEGIYTLADATPTTSAFVYAPVAPVENAFEVENVLELVVTDMEKVGETDVNGVATVSYTLGGSFEMTLARDDGATATVSASF